MCSDDTFEVFAIERAVVDDQKPLRHEVDSAAPSVPRSIQIDRHRLTALRNRSDRDGRSAAMDWLHLGEPLPD